MNFAALADAVWHVAGPLAVAILFVVGIASLVQPMIESVIWRRTLWQVCLVSFGVLLILELSGLGKSFVLHAGSGDRADQKAVPISPTADRASLAPESASRAEELNTLRLRDEFRSKIAEKVATNSSAEGQGMLSQSLGTSNVRFVLDPRSRQVSSTVVDVAAVSAGQDARLTGRLEAYPAQQLHFFDDTPAVLWVGLTWAIGSLAVLGRSFLGRLLFLLFRWRTRIVNDTELSSRLYRLAKRLGYGRDVRLEQEEDLGVDWEVPEELVLAPKFQLWIRVLSHRNNEREGSLDHDEGTYGVHPLG